MAAVCGSAAGLISATQEPETSQDTEVASATLGLNKTEMFAYLSCGSEYFQHIFLGTGAQSPVSGSQHLLTS